MAEPLIYVDQSEVREGKQGELEEAMRDLARYVEEEEPQIVSFQASLNEERSRVTVVHVHRDASSLDDHMRIAGPRFARFADLLSLVSIDVYGTPSDWAVERMRNKAETLGRGTVRVHPVLAGFVHAPGIP